MKIQPTKDRILVKEVKPDQKTESGLFITQNNHTTQYEVVVIGADVTSKDFKLTKGDKVIVAGGIPIKVQDGEFFVIKKDDILVVINKLNKQ